MRSTIFVVSVIFVLIFSTVSSGTIRVVRAGSIIGNPIVLSKVYVASGVPGITTGNNTGPPGSIVNVPSGASISPPTSNTTGMPSPGSIVKIPPGNDECTNYKQ